MPFYHRPAGARSELRPRSAPGTAHAAPGFAGPTGPSGPAPAADLAGLAAGPGAEPTRGSVGYAVVDLETTGLSPTTDSIIEIGMVLADADGEVERTWTTLINPGPGQDGAIVVGPTFIHGIVPEDLAGAPALSDVADLLVRDLSGRAVVAHNARFDVGFLTQALGARGMLGPRAHVPRVCTMEWSRHFITTPSRRLVTCCEVSGVAIGRHHTALDDALACAGLLRHYMAVGRERGERPVAWERSLAEAGDFNAWSWDDDAANAQERRLVPRRGNGVPRQSRPEVLAR